MADFVVYMSELSVYVIEGVIGVELMYVGSGGCLSVCECESSEVTVEG